MTDPRMLISAYLDGLLTDKYAAQLNDWINADPANARRFARECFIHRRLYDVMQGIDVQHLIETFETEAKAFRDSSGSRLDFDAISREELLREVITKQLEANKRDQALERERREQEQAEERERRESWARMLAMSQPGGNVKPVRRIVIPKPLFYSGIAAMIAVVITLGIAIWPERTGPQPIAEEETTPQVDQVESRTPDPIPDSRTIIASVSRIVDAQWDQAQALQVDLPLHEGQQFRLDSGVIELTMERGARVVLEAPVAVTLTGENQLRMDRGRLVAHVPRRATGFTVDGPGIQIVDLGTEFGVHVSESGKSLVHVFEGEVNAILVRADGSPIMLKNMREGEAVTLDPDDLRLDPAAAEPLAFIREAEPAKVAGRTDYARAVLADNPMAYWPLNDPSGDERVIDMAGRFNAQRMPQDQQVVDGPLVVADERSYATRFDHGGKAIDLGVHEAFQLDRGFTVEMWVRLYDMDNPDERRGWLLTAYQLGATNYGWGVGYNVPVSPRLREVERTGLRFAFFGIRDYQFSVTIEPDRWTHLTFVVNEQADVALYIDGEHHQTIRGHRPGITGDLHLRLGGVYMPSQEIDPGQFMTVCKADLAHVAVYDRALSEPQIQSRRIVQD